MRHILKNRPISKALFKIAVAVLTLAFASALAPTARAADPVDELRQILPMPLDEQQKPSGEVIEFRRATLQKKVDELKTIGELRRALGLEEWEGNQGANKELRELDAGMRRQIGTRLAKAFQDTVKNGNVDSRLAVAVAIADIGPTIRSIVEGDRHGYARSLTPEVIELTKDKDLGVRQQALRALGSIFASPKDAVPVFKAALAKTAPAEKDAPGRKNADFPKQRPSFRISRRSWTRSLPCWMQTAPAWTTKTRK
jgi:hypothetical protein